jgi:hypothetical protein
VSIRAPAGPRAPKLPSPPRAPAPARLRGAPRLPRVSGAPPPPPWAVAPAWFRRNHPAAPIDEWAIYWSLTTTYKLAEALPRAGTPPVANPTGRFLYQHPIPVPGLNQTGRNRPDFWVLPPRGVVDPRMGNGLIINPISDYTHADAAKDRRERGLLGQFHYLEIFIEYLDCLHDPDYYAGNALRGQDLSTRRG